MIDAIFSIIPRINREGYVFIFAFFIGSVILGWIWSPLLWVGLILTVWCIYFFRDPIRVTPLAEHIVIAPADGEISWAGPAVPPKELDMGEGEMFRISIFMDVFSVHVNRMPMDGVVKNIVYKAGAFNDAKLDKSSENNERNSLVIETKYGQIAVVQIAGLIARRILCWAQKDDNLNCGERFGIIRFGSRVDLYLPMEATPLVALGQKTIAGETVLAVFNNNLLWNDYRCE